MHTPGGIRTHNLSRRTAADLRLRPRRYWDRPCALYRPLILPTPPASVHGTVVSAFKGTTDLNPSLSIFEI
jgi:hypothetical protein